MKTALWASALAVGLLAGQVCEAAGPDINVVTNGHRGSVLAFPFINIDPGWDTSIEISNDSSLDVEIKCIYVNEQKGRNNFTFPISHGGTVSWDVSTRSGDHVVPSVWPINSLVAFLVPPFEPTSVTRGELICIAIDANGQSAIAFNRLHGTATVFSTGLLAPALEAKQAFKYNAFAFRAWNANDLALDGTTMALPIGGIISLPLTGALVGLAYDACPVVNSTPFMPAGATLGNLRTVKNSIHGIGCNQDLTEDTPNIYTTELNFTVENSNEQTVSGARICVDSVFSVDLGSDTDPEPWFTNVSNFWFSTLLTPNARFEMQGDPSGNCSKAGTINTGAGLLTVMVSKIAIFPFPAILPPPAIPGFDQTVANTMMTVGAAVPPYEPAAGFIVFDSGL